VDNDIIKNLIGLDDAALSKKLGFADKVAAFKIDLSRADSLTGDARKSVQADLTRMFTPSDYTVSDLGYKVDRAERMAKCDKDKTTPASVLDGACDCAEQD
jgi:hypothetical protein